MNKTRKCSVGLESFEKNKKTTTSMLRKTNKRKKKEIAKELLSTFAPKSISPRNDFYGYINYQWLKNISIDKLQKYIVQIDDFRLSQDRVYHQLHNLVINYYKNNNNKLSKNIKNYYNSIINMNNKQDSRQRALDVLRDIEQCTSPWELLAYVNKDEMNASYAPFVWSVNPDDKDNKVYRCSITAGAFNLIDVNVYFDDGTDVVYKRKYRNAYNKYIDQVFTVLLGKNHGYNPQDVYDVEVSLFDALGCVSVTRKEEKVYNKVWTKDVLRLYGFDWPEFARCLGYKKVPSFFLTSSLNYLKCGTALLIENWNSPKWKTYWLFMIYKNIVRITKDWEKITYNFKGKFERGQTDINNINAVSSILYMSIPFNTFLTNQYISHYKDENVIEYARIMCEDLKAVFRRMLQRNTWLKQSTKEYALTKLDRCIFVYGNPSNLRPDPDLSYGTNLYENMKKIHTWRQKQLLTLEGKPIIDIPQMDWTNYPVKLAGEQAYIVNASYTPNKNQIYINLGYLQPPFVDLHERGIEYNLAHLGFTVAHELGHGFDDWGSQYGWDGNLHDWWTESDKRKYKAMQRDVINQYETFAERDNITFDASIGIGEDLADIQSLSICDEYLHDYQNENQDLVPISALGFQAFYTYFASQQRQFINKKALSAQLKTNPHPLDKYRCNIPLSRSIIFRSLYNVQKGDKMWWHNTNTIW